MNEWRNLYAGREKWSAFVFGEAQSALTGDIADPDQIVDFEERARRSFFFTRFATLFALDQHAAPAIRRGVTDRSEYLSSGCCVVRTFAKR